MYSFIYIYIIIFLVIIPSIFMNKRIVALRQIRKRGAKRVSLEILKECTGKVCAILCYGEVVGTTGKVVAIEGNWMKVQAKKQVKLINTDMIINITILPEKYQK